MWVHTSSNYEAFSSDRWGQSHGVIKTRLHQEAWFLFVLTYHEHQTLQNLPNDVQVYRPDRS
jgi:hypothetical protein